MNKFIPIFPIIFCYIFILNSSIYSSQMPKSSTQNLSNKKINFSSDKKDDPVLSDDQMEEFLYENGNPIFNNNKETSDTLETDAFQEE